MMTPPRSAVRPLLTTLALALALALVSVPRPASAGDEPPDLTAPTSREAEVLASEHQLARVSQTLPGELASYRRLLADQQRRLERLVATEGLVARNPWEMRARLSLLESLRQDVDKGARPLTQRRQLLDELATLAGELAGELRTGAAHLTDEEAKTTAVTGSARAAAVAQRAGGLRSQVSAALRPGEKLAKSLDGRIGDHQTQLSTLWRAYYLEPDRSYASVAGLEHLGSQTKLWAARLPALTKALAPSREAWLGLLLNAVLFIGLAWAAGGIMIRRLRTRWPVLAGLPLHRHWALVALGVGLLIAGVMVSRSQQDRVAFVAELAITYGLLDLLWTVRRLNRARDDDPTRNPLRSLWVVFALGVVLQATGAPSGAVTILWCLFTAAMVRHLLRRRERRVPKLERVVLLASPWLLSAGGVTAALGWGQLAMTLCAGWVVLVMGVQTIATIHPALSRWDKQAATSDVPALVRGLALGVAFPVTWLVGLAGLPVWLSRRLGGDNLLWRLLNEDLGWGPVSVSVLRIVAVVIGLFLVRVALSAVRAAIERLYPREEDSERGVADSLATVATYVGWILYGFGALLLLGVSFTSVAVIAGGLSVGIGFGLQNIVNNLVSGVLLLIGGSIRPGDVLQIGDVYGVVKRVTIRNTIVQTYENSTLFVPNSELVSNRVTNWTHRDRRIRRDVLVGVAYGSDTELTRRILLQVATDHALVLTHPAPMVLFSAFGESSLDFVLRVWLDDFDHSVIVPSDLRDGIDRAFRAEGIEISFPQRDLHLRTAPGLASALSSARPSDAPSPEGTA